MDLNIVVLVDHRAIDTFNIQMVDLGKQYNRLKLEIDKAIQNVLDRGDFINGRAVRNFATHFQNYLGAKKVVPCGNGTDALQIALMAIDVQPGDEVILPAFTYVATAEVISLLGLKPILVDVDLETFNITADAVEKAITPKTKAVIPVNLYGQCADLENVKKLCDVHGLFMIEDNAQSIGADFTTQKGDSIKAGLVGHIGCTSFYPSKNLGAFGDGGALYTNDEVLGHKIHMIANHGQSRKYVHDLVGCNSRLDSIQAAILDVKLKYLDDFIDRRQEVADRYDLELINNEYLSIPKRISCSSHVFHQYTLKVHNGERDQLKEYLGKKGIPTMIYYPVPLYRQKAYASEVASDFELINTEQLCKSVLSIPMHTEMSIPEINYITTSINNFF